MQKINIKRLLPSASVAGIVVGFIVFGILGWAFLNVPSLYIVKFDAEQQSIEYFIQNPRIFNRKNYMIDNIDEREFDIVSFVRRNEIDEYTNSFLGVLNFKLANAILQDVNKNKADREIMRRHQRGIDVYGGYDTDTTMRIKLEISYLYSYTINYLSYLFVFTINLLIWAFLAGTLAMAILVWFPRLARSWFHWVTSSRP